MSLTIHGNGVLEGMTEVNIAGAVNASTIVTLTAANTVAIGAADSNTVYVVGTTPIAGYDSVAVGIRRTVVYTGITTLLHNAISHIVRGGVNKVTAIGDSAEWISLGGGNWFMLDYASSSSVVSGPSQVTLNGAETLTNKKISAVYIANRTLVENNASGTVNLDVNDYSVFNVTLTGDSSIDFTDYLTPMLANETVTFVVKITQGATARSLTWLDNITWLTTSGSAPATPLANKTTEYIFTKTGSTAIVGRSNTAGTVASEVTLNGAETLTNKKISAVYILDKISTVSAATGTVTLNLANASIFNLTLTGNTTLALSNVPVLDQEILSIVITVTQGATPYTLTWFNGLTWRTIGGVAAAAPAANKTTEYIITSTATGAYIGRKGAAT